MRSDPHLQPAYVIHARPYRETSLLLEVLTPESGRLGVVARGVRRPKSALKPLLQPFRPLLMAWRGRGALVTLTGAESAGAAVALRGRSLWNGLYVNELVQRLLPRHDSHPPLFAAYGQTLQELAAAHGKDREEPVLRYFERDLLDAIGYGLVLDRETDTGEVIDAQTRYFYRLDHGPTGEDDGYSPRIRGAALKALVHSQLHDPESLREVKRLMRTALALHLGPRPLRSRELFSRL